MGQTKIRSFRNLWRELRRRRVVHAAGIFLAAGWLILQVVDVVLTQLGLPAWSVSLLAWLVFLGFPIILILSWRYDVSWDGISLTAPAESTADMDLSLRLIDYLVILFILVFLVLVSITLARVLNKESEFVSDRKAEPNSIAVLPFENMSSRREEDYFGHGLAEDILHRLASIEELRVASRTAAFELDTTNLDMAAVGLRLAVEFVLEGSFRKDGEQVRIVAQLIDTDTGYHVWSGRYDRDMEGLFRIYDEISSAVVTELQLAIVPGATAIGIPPTEDMQAYDYFLQARSILQRSTRAESAADAQKLFSRAVERDPDFAGAWAGRCQAYLAWHIYEPEAGRLESAKTSCRKALDLKPDLLEGHVAMGDMYRNTGHYEFAISQYHAALKEDPGMAMAWRGLGQAYAEIGKPVEAENAMLKAVAIEPDDLANFIALGTFYFARGQYADSAETYGRMADHPRAGASAFNGLGASYYMLADFQNAATAYRRVIESEPTASAFSNIGGMYYYDGQFEDAVIMYREAVELSPKNPVWRGNLADALREIEGRKDEARQAYEKAAGLTEKLLEADPEDAELLTNMAHFHSRLGHDELAMNYMELALNTSPDDVYAHYYASLVHLEAGRLEQSLQEINRSVELGYPVVLLRSDPQFLLQRDSEKFIELIGEGAPFD